MLDQVAGGNLVALEHALPVERKQRRVGLQAYPVTIESAGLEKHKQDHQDSKAHRLQYR